MNSPADHSKQPDDDSQSTPWWNPFHWPAGIWVLIVALLLMSTPFAIRNVMLMGIPAIPEPFDIAEFSKWDIPASEDAFTEYRRAWKLQDQVTDVLVARGTADASEPEDCLALLDAGWAQATDPAKKWLELHQESLACWRRGTQMAQGLNESPATMTFTTLLNVVQDQRKFVRLAILAEAKAISESQLDEARQWARAMYRCGGHTSHRGPMIQGLVSSIVHYIATKSTTRWAELPEVTSEQLRQALTDLRSDYQLYESPANIAKTEYLSLRNTLQDPKWIEIMAPVDPNSPSTAAAGKAMRLGYWVIGEPELTLRISRHVIANQIPEVDKPQSQRAKLVGAGSAMLFDTDPTATQVPGQLDPVGIDRAIKRSSLTRLLLPSMKMLDDALLRQQALRATLEVVLAAQTYRRDRGEFPMTLSDLVPKYLESVPIDPCHPSGSPLLYRRDEPTKAIVWSVGNDGNDDGGVLEIPNAKAPDVGFVVK